LGCDEILFERTYENGIKFGFLAQPSVYLLLRHPFQQPSRPLTPGQLNGGLAPKQQ